jgi:outer membrane protein assembly factor BamB
MKKQFIVGFAFMSLGFLLLRCSKEHLDSSPKVIWETKITHKTTFGSIPPIIHGDRVAISVDSVYISSPIFLFDKNTGHLIQKWDDFFEPNKETISSIINSYQNEAQVSFCIGRKTFTIDINTGQTIFKKWQTSAGDGGLGDITGLSNLLYRGFGNGLAYNDSEDCIMEYNNITNGNRIVYSAKGKDGYQVGLRFINVSIDKQQDTILIITNNMYHFGLKQTKTFLTKYNITQKQVLFEKELSNSENYGTPCASIIKNGRLYSFLGAKIFCHDLETGEHLWFKELDRPIVSSDPVIANNTLYVNDESKTLSALNLETGQLLWKTATAGTCRDLKYMNEVLYVVGGSDGLLYAVDATNGQFFYKFRCPDENRSSQFFWQNVTVDPSTKRLYATSYGTLYCLSAVR